MSAPVQAHSNDALEAALRAEPLRALDARGRADVRACGKLRHYDAGTLVYVPDEPADGLFVLAHGQVRLEQPSGGAEPSSGRGVRAGELFGHEALVPFAVRRSRAVTVEASSALELSVGVLKRVLVRAGCPELLVREETRARRSEWLALLARTPFGTLPSSELEALAGLVVEEPRGPGDALARGGQQGEGVWLVAGGLFELRESSEDARPVRPLYAARGDFIGFRSARGERCDSNAVALGAALALRLPLAAFERVAGRHPNVLSALERAISAREAKQRRTLEAARRPATRHAADEMERLGSARSLLAIDLDRCTRCGHCAWACAESHGSARLERRGEKLVVTLRNDDSVASKALLLPNACQHCREPACLDPCPTAAIRRDATGAVELDQDLCTGCGACAKACPWQAIRIAPRLEAPDGHTGGGKSADVAVKCDLCRGHDGPECVSACPTDAIFRLDPARDVVEVRAAVGRKPEAREEQGARRRLPVRRLVALGLVPPFVALERAMPRGAGDGSRFFLGLVGGALVLLLLSHAVVKRFGRVRRRARLALARSGTVSTVSPFVALHVGSGITALGCVFLHSGFRVPAGVTGALALSFWGVAASGAFGALVYRFLPARLTRIERRMGLPEDESEEREALFDRLHAAVSGANSAKKELVHRILLPYGRASSGMMLLALSGRSLAAEEARLVARVEQALGGRKSERLVGMEELVRTAVEMRALGARRILRGLLRSWLPLHLVGSALLLALLGLHVIGALR
jgi:Fe-S-cluster-containing dehydrogenase component